MRTPILPTGDPAGTIATRTAGAAEFFATLLWDGAEEMPPAPTLPVLDGNVLLSVVETDEPSVGRREILGEVLAMTERELGAALETVLRSLADAAALSGALLETRVAHVARPAVAPSGAVQALALDLWGAGFAVRFGPSWTPSPMGGLVVGFGGASSGLAKFLGAHPSWEVL